MQVTGSQQERPRGARAGLQRFQGQGLAWPSLFFLFTVPGGEPPSLKRSLLQSRPLQPLHVLVKPDLKPLVPLVSEARSQD